MFKHYLQKALSIDLNKNIRRGKVHYYMRFECERAATDGAPATRRITSYLRRLSNETFYLATVCCVSLLLHFRANTYNVLFHE